MSSRVHVCDILRTFKQSEGNDLSGNGWTKERSGSRVLGLIYLMIFKGYAAWLQHTETHMHFESACCSVTAANCTKTL